MSRALNDLAPAFRPLAFELIARSIEAGIAVMIINTLRTAEDQAANLAKGVSWVQHSMHQDGLAIDICPFDTWTLHGANKLAWNGKDPTWQQLGRIGEALGLRWGGRWTIPDLGHFEMTGGAHATPLAV